MSPAIEPRLAVITVLYRSSEMLVKTLPTWVGSARGLPVEFIFVDNSPEDGSRDVIADSLGGEGYRYLPDPSNPGFAAGCNRAVAATMAPHVLLLNPDVWLAEDSLARILAAIERTPDSPIAVGMTMHGRDYVGIDVNLIGLFIDRPAVAGRPPLGPSGGAGVYPTALFRRFTGFYEKLFAWGEDADLAYRMHAGGVRTGTLNLSLPHAWGHSVEGNQGLSEFRAFLLARNRLLVAARTFTGPLLVLALPVIALAHCALAVRRIRQGLLKPFLRGVGRGLADGPAARGAWRGERFGVANLVDYLRGGQAR